MTLSPGVAHTSGAALLVNAECQEMLSVCQNEDNVWKTTQCASPQLSKVACTLLSTKQRYTRKAWLRVQAPNSGAVLQDVMQKYSSIWSEDAWEEAYARALAYVCELPHARTVGPAGSQDLVRALPSVLQGRPLARDACRDIEDGGEHWTAGGGHFPTTEKVCFGDPR